MAEIWTMGETLVEIMRTEVDKPLNETGLFSGPYPSGSSAIMISTVARMGHSCGIISGVGNDGFGECMLNRLKKDGVDVSKVLVDPDGSTACAFVAYDSQGDRRYLFHWDETPATKAVMPDVTEPSLKEAKYFHVMGCALTAKLSYGWEIVKTARAMKAQGTKISFDPNVRTEHLTNPKKTNLFAPGLDELKLVTGIDDVEEAVKKCFENPNLEILMLKKGVLIATGTPSTLLKQMENRVWELSVPEAQISQYQGTYAVTNISKHPNQSGAVVFRVLSDRMPDSHAVPVSPTLEDYYLYTFGGEGSAPPSQSEI